MQEGAFENSHLPRNFVKYFRRKSTYLLRYLRANKVSRDEKFEFLTETVAIDLGVLRHVELSNQRVPSHTTRARSYVKRATRDAARKIMVAGCARNYGLVKNVTSSRKAVSPPPLRSVSSHIASPPPPRIAFHGFARRCDRLREER